MENNNLRPHMGSDVLRHEAVDAAWEQAIQRHHALALLGPSNSLRTLMSRVVDEAIENGVVDFDELTMAALAVVPKLRRPNKQAAE